MGRQRVELRDAKQKWRDNAKRHRRLGAEFNLTFEEWYKFWLDHGVDKNIPITGYNKHSLVLVRIDDTKPFSIDNIHAATRGSTNTGRPCRSLGKSRPNTWKIKDPELHKMYIPFLKAKAQTDYRVRHGIAVGEWQLSFDEFVQLWGDLWDLRGRGSNDMTLTRDDFEGDWNIKNCVIVPRSEQLRRGHAYKMATGRTRGWKKRL